MKEITKIIIFMCFCVQSTTNATNHQYPSGWADLQNNHGWNQVADTERVKIYRKKLDVSPMPAFKAELISDIDINILIETAWLVEESLEIFPNAYIIDSGIYNYVNDTTYTAYQIIDIPFLSKRLYQFNSIKIINSIHWTKTDTINSKLNHEELIIPPINFGSWEVVKIRNKSKLIYKVCTDPGGEIPLWIVEQANQRYLPKMLLDLENYAKKWAKSKKF